MADLVTKDPLDVERKLVYATLAGAITVVVGKFAAVLFPDLAPVLNDPDVRSSMVVIIGGLVGYLARSRP